MSTTIRKISKTQRLALTIIAASPGGITNAAFEAKMAEQAPKPEVWMQPVSDLFDDGIIRSPTNKKRTKLDTKRLMLSEDGAALCRELGIPIARSVSDDRPPAEVVPDEQPEPSSRVRGLRGRKSSESSAE